MLSGSWVPHRPVGGLKTATSTDPKKLKEMDMLATEQLLKLYSPGGGGKAPVGKAGIVAWLETGRS